MPAQKKFYRSDKDKIIAGVAGGLGQYFGVDSTLIRVVFVLLALMEGAGVIIYIILAIITPKRRGKNDPEENLKEMASNAKDQSQKMAQNFKDNSRMRTVLGAVIVFVGLILLIKSVSPVPVFGWVNWELVWPLLVILIGMFIIFKNKK